jgi:2-keto-4-pentenoate hydratase/2-oxohepta-3-ene-1,7-dioic acid hydratase in catechol pathway
MRLVTYDSMGIWRSGVVIKQWVVDSLFAAKAANLTGVVDAHWLSNRHIIQLSPSKLSKLEQSAISLANLNPSHPKVYLAEDVRLGPPIPDPDKIICLGLNYRSHAEEAGLKLPEVPLLFAKYRNALNGPSAPILLPKLSQQIDYEGELAVVIGRTGKDIPVEDALNFAAGYMVFNDISARDLQMRTGQWLSGKTLDTFAPCGPVLVVNEIQDPQTLRILTRVNGQTLQDGQTKDMIFSVAESIAYISQLVTLQPGDIIATGTPEGVGFKRTPPIFLHHGDLVEVEIKGIGILKNPVVDPTKT